MIVKFKKFIKINKYDVIVIGGGAAGMAAAVNAASEKMKVAVLEAKPQPGGGARESWAIENVIGFPKGVTGVEFYKTITDQAAKFDVHIQTNCAVKKIETIGNHKFITAENGEKFMAPTVIVATGLEPKPLPVIEKFLEKFIDKGVYYGMPPEVIKTKTSRLRANEGNVALIGAGNSSGQAALKLASIKGITVNMVVRGVLDTVMSHYLVAQIRSHKHIKIFEKSNIVDVKGKDDWCSAIKLDNGTEIPVNAVFSYAGAVPEAAEWLKASGINLDEQGFVKTGKEVNSELKLETSVHGVFCAGDIRSGSDKRIQVAAGEGSSAISNIHAYMGNHPEIKSYYTPKQIQLKSNPCKYAWQKAADGSICGDRASLSPQTSKDFMLSLPDD
jgi:thioredoxin reductase (NADPH)